MLESNLVEGNQSLGDSSTNLVFGKSITDSCINWDTTNQIIKKALRIYSIFLIFLFFKKR